MITLIHLIDKQVVCSHDFTSPEHFWQAVGDNFSVVINGDEDAKISIVVDKITLVEHIPDPQEELPLPDNAVKFERKQYDKRSKPRGL